MNDLTPQGEFHHFQLVNASGEVPLSISILVHYNQPTPSSSLQAPISTDDIIQLHDALQRFDGDFSKAFSSK